ncbi:MAG: NAD(P)/FAD-dependent oxidoreductase [Myxococcota bacterium]|nr:NAD(P)/FAD-dependent oxidoreductase [Myxococcota bacterium]
MTQTSLAPTGSPENTAAVPRQPGRHRVVIVGGGFGGLYAAQQLRRAPVDLTLVDRRNFHLFQPLLYQVATGGLSAGDISSPIRRALRMQRNARVLLGEVVDVDAERRFIELRDGERLPYDTLIVATGARHHYFGNDDWERRAPGLKSVEDATEMRRRILLAFERAERERDPAARRALLSFVIVGAGPTGVELAGAICELARDTLRHDFRSIDPRETRVLLVEGADRVLPVYPADLSAKAQASLERLGAEIRVNTLVKDLDEDGVTLESGGQRERVPARCVLWAAGVRASSLARVLEKQAGASLDRAGRVLVEPDCSLPGHPEILAIGDIANFSHQGDAPLPGVAPVAMQQGRYVARSIARRLEGREAEPFRYRDKGSMATIGRKSAVANFGRIRFGGLPAWLLWSAVHVLFLIEYENRVLVALRWIWNYVTRNRGTRLITKSADAA